MKELLKKIMERAENPETVDFSEEGIRKEAKELGYSDAEIEKALKDFDDFPLSDEVLENITGGGSIHYSFKGRVQH